MAVISGNNILPGARPRLGAESGSAGNLSGYGPTVYGSTANGGTPAGGTVGFGAGTLQPGALVIASSSAKLFINTNTKASPTWTVVGGQS